MNLDRELKRRSKLHGGAWIYSVLPFTHDVKYRQFPCPSAVPDQYYDTADNKIGWRGRIIPFTKAAQIREQNRGITCQ